MTTTPQDTLLDDAMPDLGLSGASLPPGPADGEPPPPVDDPALVLAAAVLTERGDASTWREAPLRSSLASAVIAAVMTPRITTSSVDACVLRYEEHFGPGAANDLAASFVILGDGLWRERIGTNHRTTSNLAAPYKSTVIRQAAELLAAEGVQTRETLLARSRDDALRAAWCGLPGQSSGFTWRHLLQAAGGREVLLCPLTRRFARRALPREIASSAQLAGIIDDAAMLLDVSPVDVEHQMWRAGVHDGRRRP